MSLADSHGTDSRGDHDAGRARTLAVLGSPIAHSKSPLLHAAAYRALGLPWSYSAVEVVEGSLGAFVNTCDASWRGLSLTMPLKREVLPMLASRSKLVETVGAANTVLFDDDGALHGFNTDVAGIVRPLEKRLSLRGARVLVLGAGGAARAAVHGLAEKGAQVSIWSRKESAARELASTAHAQVLSRAEVAATPFDVLINATPCGMTGNHHPLPLEDHEWKARLVFDLVYNPLDTPLLQVARARGIAVIQGYEMFVHQGARQFELWTGKPAPEAEMLRVVLFALKKNHTSHDQ